MQIDLTVFRQVVTNNPVRQDDNLNVWLLQHCVKFPSLESLFRIVHSVPATSVTSERVFSRVGLILANKLRNRLIICVKMF